MKDRISCRARRRWAPTCAVICLFLVVFLAGCQGSSPPPEPVTIKFAYLEDIIDKDYYEPLVEAFNERHPHITVELTGTAFDMLYQLPATTPDADVFIVDEWTCMCCGITATS
jgi:ABC-type glycerol-3-phosphate transport system substrate-binding protein